MLVGAENKHDVHDCFFFNLHYKETVFSKLFDILQLVQIIQALCEFDSLRLTRILGDQGASFELAVLLSLSSFTADKVDQSAAFETSTFNFSLRDNSDFKVLVGEILSSNDVSSKKIITVFWTQFVDILRNKLPKRLEARSFVHCFFEIVLISAKR